MGIQIINGKNLKRARSVISVACLVLISCVFIDIYGKLTATSIKAILYLQFIPSLMKSTTGHSTGIITGFTVVLVLTVLFGRIYCSFFCPLGAAMDVIARLKPGKRFTFKKKIPYLRFVLLFFTVASFLAGSLAFINLLDPFSIFGRLATTLIRPLVVWGNNGLGRILESAGFYSLFPLPMQRIWLPVLATSIGYLVFIAVLALRRGRLYCNTLCPVGTFLGLVSRFSIVKFRINADSCTRCGRCEKICKAECVESDKGFIDSSRCVGCFNCLTVCASKSIVFSSKKSQEDRKSVV
jgi:polyferredoxin